MKCRAIIDYLAWLCHKTQPNISTGKYTDGVDEVLLKIMRSKLKKVRVKYA